MNRCRGVGVAAALMLLAACAQSKPVDTAADVAAIKAMQDRELAVVASGNVDTAMTAYAPDLIMMAPGEPMVVGSDAVRKWLSTTFAEVTITGKYSSADVEVSGDLAVVRYVGNLTVTPRKGGAAATEHIQGLHVYKRQADGSWKISQDVWNVDTPAPPPTPPTGKKR